MKYRYLMVVLTISSICSACGSSKPVDRINEEPVTLQEYVKPTEPEKTTSAPELKDRKNSLSDVNLGRISDDDYDTESYEDLIVPTQSTKESDRNETTAETTTEEYSDTQIYGSGAYSLNQSETSTDIQTTEASTTAVGAEKSTGYFENYTGTVHYKTDVTLPDVAGIDKDKFGNYIISKEMYTRRDKLPLNSRGKIPYLFCYDELGNIVNPFPDELKDYKDLYEVGSYLDANGKKVLIPTKSAD